MSMTQRYRDGYLSDEPLARFEKMKSSRHKNSPEEIRQYQIRKARKNREQWKDMEGQDAPSRGGSNGN